MKIILVLIVVVFKYVRLSTAGEELTFQETLDTHSECQGEDCLALDTSINHRSLDAIDEHFPLEKLAKRQLRETKYSIRNIRKRINKAADKKIFKMLKVVKSHRNHLKRLAKKGLKNILSLMKMSRGELRKLTRNNKMAIKMTVSGCNKISKFVVSSAQKLSKTIDNAGEDIKELAEKYWREFMSAQRQNLQYLLDKKLPFSDWLRSVNEMVDLAGFKLSDVYHTADTAITNLAGSSGSMATEISRSSCHEYQKLANTESMMEAYIDHSCKQFAEIAQMSSDKFYEIAKSCLAFLCKLVGNSANSLRRLRDALHDWNTAAINGEPDKVHGAQDCIHDIQNGMGRSNAQIYHDMMANTSHFTDDLFNSVKGTISKLKGCNETACPEVDD